MSKKSTYKVLAEALTSGKLKDFNIPLDHLDKRKLTVDEIKDIIREAFGKAKDVADVRAKELKHGWGDADLEKQVNWVDALKLKEFFDSSLKAEACDEEGKDDEFGEDE